MSANYMTTECNLAGCSFDSRQAYLAWLRMNDQTPMYFEREATNPFDTNAVKAVAEGPHGPLHIGYLPKDIAASIAPLMDAGRKIIIVQYKVIGGTEGKSFGCIVRFCY